MNKKIKEELPKEETKKSLKEYHGDLRGFKTFEEAINYPNTPEFKSLDIGCKTEYTNWLKNILEEK